MYTTVIMIAMATTGGHKNGCYSCASAASSCSTCTVAVASSCCKREGLFSRLFRHKCNGCDSACNGSGCSSASSCNGCAKACNGGHKWFRKNRCNGNGCAVSYGCAVSSGCAASSSGCASGAAPTTPTAPKEMRKAPKADTPAPKTTSVGDTGIDAVSYEMPEATYVSEPIIVFARN